MEFVLPELTVRIVSFTICNVPVLLLQDCIQ